MLSLLPTILDSQRAFREDRLQPIDLVEFCLDRIAQFDRQVGAWVMVDDAAAIREAQRLGDLTNAGKLIGPLHGIPVGIKDIIDVKGLPTRAGSSLRADHVAEADAPVVSSLRAAGAIILGKTVTTEFAFLDPSRTKNPWNLRHTPGGSSSGSAAAVAMQMCVAALGSQTGGSIIRPASYCGVAGLKPRHDRLSTVGVVPVSPLLDHIGSLARNVGDLQQVFHAMMGDSAEFPDENPEQGTASDAPPLVIMEDYFLERAASDVRQLTGRVLEMLRRAGAELSTIPLPESFDELHQMHRRIMACQAAQFHATQYAAHRDAYGPKISRLVDEGLSVTRSEWDQAVAHRSLFQQQLREILGRDRTALMPSTVTSAPASLRTTGDPSFNSPWSYAGIPAATIPIGCDTSGLPLGLQLIAEEESTLLGAARWCERVIGTQPVPRSP